MRKVFKKIQVRVTGEIRWKMVLLNDIHPETMPPRWNRGFAESHGVRSMRVLISPNMAVVEIFNTFPGELGLISEEDRQWKFGLINTTVQESSDEVDS